AVDVLCTSWCCASRVHGMLLVLVHLALCFVFFFSSRRRHTRSKRDWSSDVCSSDLVPVSGPVALVAAIGRQLLGVPDDDAAAVGRDVDAAELIWVARDRSVGDAPLVLVVVDPLPGLAAVHGAEDPAFAVALRGGEDRRTIPAGRGRAEADHVGRVEARELFPAVPAVCRTEQPVDAVPVALGVSAGRPYLAGDAGDGGQVHLPAAWEHCGGVGSSGLCEGEAAIRRRVHRSVGPRVDELRVDAVGFHSGEAVDPGGLLPGLTVIGADLHPDTWGGPDGGS